MRTGRAEGFTLVEAIITVALIALITIPLGRIFMTTQSAANDNTARQQGLGLDTAILARMGAIPYSELGLTSIDVSAANTADPGYSAAAGGTLATVAAGGQDLDGAFKFGPNQQIFNVVLPKVFWGDRNFKVITYAVTANSNVPACPSQPGHAVTTPVTGVETRVTVVASWFSQLSGWINATESTVLYPGGLAPYQGSGTPPAEPGNPTAATTATIGGVPFASTTQRVYVSWAASGAGCYAVSWVTPDQAIHSTGLLANSDPGYIQSPPSTGSGTAWYAVDGLPQNQPLTFFVTSYSADGTVSTQSIDTLGTVLAPSGPLVTRVTSSTCPTGVSSPCPYGGGGSTIVVTAGGTGFGGGAAMMLVQSGRSVGLGTCSASPCSLTAPTGLTGLWSIVATAGGVSSPPIPASDFDFGPAIQSVSPSSGTALQKVTITGTNFLLGTTFTFTYPTGSGPEGLYTWTAGPTASTTSYTCTTAQSATVGGISCSFVMPSFTGQLLANGLTQSTGELSATSLGGTSTTTPGDVFTYTIA